MSNVINMQQRSGLTKSELKQLRAKGQIPAVVYGNKIGNIPVSVEEKEIIAALKRNPNVILEAMVSAHGTYKVMVHQTQKDKMTGQLRHIDFHQINMRVKVDSMLPIHYSGEPKGVKEGGILQVGMHEVKVRCLPDKLPGRVEMDISGLAVGDQLLVSDLELDKALEMISEPHGMLVTILSQQRSEPEAVMETENGSEDAVNTDKAEASK